MENNLKLVALKAACDAAEAAPFDSDNLETSMEAVRVADAAYFAELDKAKALEAKFYAEFNDSERDSGICNARDTACEYGLYRKHGEMVERSTEFWELAIGSAQFMRDCA